MVEKEEEKILNSKGITKLQKSQMKFLKFLLYTSFFSHKIACTFNKNKKKIDQIQIRV